MTYYFSTSKISEMVALFKNGASVRALAQKFECSYFTIRAFLEKNIENYKQIAKEHQQERGRKVSQLQKTEKQLEAGSKNIAKWREKHPEELAEQCQKVGQLPATEKTKKAAQKTGSLPKTESQLEASSKSVIKMNESNAKNHNFISRPEALFYLTCLTKTFYPKDIVPQYFIKEINHRADFAVPSQKLLFEVDGDYYHGHSGNTERDKRARKHDAQINKWAKDNGWAIFRYNDEKLKKLGILR